MRSTILVIATALALGGCSMMPSFGGGDKEAAAPTAAATVAPMAAPAPEAEVYEIQHLVRGPVRRVKVLRNGMTVETLIMSKGRTKATSHCCTADGCATIEAAKACTTFKMTCDEKGACKRDDAGKSTSKL
jgi:hypothetical protein